MQNMKAPDDLFSMLLARLGMKRNILPPKLRTQADSLAAALRHHQWSVRVAAVLALGKLEGQGPIEPLVIALLADEHEAVRAAAARQLGELREPVPVEPLVYALDDPSWMVRADAAYALGKLGAHAPIEPLVKALKDEDTTVRAAAAQALGEMGERAPIDALVSTLADQEWLVREAVVLALGKMGNRVPVAPLLVAMHDEEETVREAAQLTLQHIRPYGLAATALGPPSPPAQSTDEEAEQMPHAQMQANDTYVSDTTKPDTQGTPFQNNRPLGAIFITQPQGRINKRSFPETQRARTKNTHKQNDDYRPVNHSARITHDPVSSAESPHTPHSQSQASRRPLQPLILIGLAALVVIGLILAYIIAHLQ